MSLRGLSGLKLMSKAFWLIVAKNTTCLTIIFCLPSSLLLVVCHAVLSLFTTPATCQVLVCEVCSFLPELIWNSLSDVLALVGAKPLNTLIARERPGSANTGLEPKMEQHKTSGVSFLDKNAWVLV